MIYMVKAKNKRGYTHESEQSTDYGQILKHAMDCLNSNEYSSIVIVSDMQDGVNDGILFLHRIIK